MNEAKFYYWQNKLKDQLPPRRGFVPLSFSSQGEKAYTPGFFGETRNQQPFIREGISCEISYPNGISVKLSGMADADMLRSLLQLTGQ